jgi:hypothetical protein
VITLGIKRVAIHTVTALIVLRSSRLALGRRAFVLQNLLFLLGVLLFLADDNVITITVIFFSCVDRFRFFIECYLVIAVRRWTGRDDSEFSANGSL